MTYRSQFILKNFGVNIIVMYINVCVIFDFNVNSYNL